MSLETRLNDSLNDVLKTLGFIFEIINNNKKQLNLITGTNNQLILQLIVQQLSRLLQKFDEILDDTVSKYNDVLWCINDAIARKQQEAELKIKLERERQRAEEEAKRQEEARRLQEEKRKRDEQERLARLQQEKEQERLQKERAERERQERELAEKRRQETEKHEREAREAEALLADFNQPFTFDMGAPNPTDILLLINYPSQGGPKEDSAMMNDLLQNDELLLGGLDMDLMDVPFDGGGDQLLDDGFDVDNFLNQLDS